MVHGRGPRHERAAGDGIFEWATSNVQYLAYLGCILLYLLRSRYIRYISSYPAISWTDSFTISSPEREGSLSVGRAPRTVRP